MKRNRWICLIMLAAVALASVLLSCSPSDKRTALKVLIVPKFEIDEISGDFPGEAQLFYEKYCEGCEERTVEHMPPAGHFYVNDENGVGMLITGSCKTAASLALSAVLSDDEYDFTDTYIVSVGCAGGSASYCTLGDVILVTSACDYDLGHHVDAHEKTESSSKVMWFPDDAYLDYECEYLNPELCEKVYQMIRDCPLRTTDMAKEVMKNNLPERSEAEIIPSVKKGTALTGDNFWKGSYGHATAKYIADYYKTPDPYAVTEMEDVAIANTAQCYGMLDRLITLRTVVNLDIFLDDETPESTWGVYGNYNNKVKEENEETLDVFGPAMQNLFDTGSIVIDSILEGTL